MSIQVQRKQSGLPCAMALRLIRALPGDRAFLPPSTASAFQPLRPWRQRRGVRTTRLRRTQTCASSTRSLRPPQPVPTSVTWPTPL